MDLKDLKTMIAAGESQTLEFKEAFSNEAVETIAAFSNTNGGTVLLGIADNGQVSGLNLNAEKLQQWVNEVKYFVKRLFAGISSPVSLHKIYNELRSQGYKADKNLLYELMEELNSICFFFPLRKYSASVIKRETTEKKFYAVDNGLAAAVSFNIGEDHGKLLENAVFMQFHATGSDIYFYKDKKECDFIRLSPKGKPEAYQAAYDLAAQDTKKREFAGLLEACKRLGLNRGTVITMSEEFEEKVDGVQIKVVPFYKWALSTDS